VLDVIARRSAGSPQSEAQKATMYQYLNHLSLVSMAPPSARAGSPPQIDAPAEGDLSVADGSLGVDAASARGMRESSERYFARGVESLDQLGALEMKHGVAHHPALMEDRLQLSLAWIWFPVHHEAHYAYSFHREQMSIRIRLPKSELRSLCRRLPEDGLLARCVHRSHRRAYARRADRHMRVARPYGRASPATCSCEHAPDGEDARPTV
jgi:hypothetical protein